MTGDRRPIGMFDSGVGGLTVARAVLDLLPAESLLYLGDTAHAPYGPRPVPEIRARAREVAAALLARDVKMLVVACNSVEVAAIDDLTSESGVPVVGVIDPGVRAAVAATRSGRIGVIGTEATIASGAYERSLARQSEGMRLVAAACPRFVPFVEQGVTSGPEIEAAARGYLAPLLAAEVDTLILGCTHYPLLAGLLQLICGPEVVLVSSAEETAKDVYAALTRDGLTRADAGAPEHAFLCTGDAERFRELAGTFLGPEIGTAPVSRLPEAAWS